MFHKVASKIRRKFNVVTKIGDNVRQTQKLAGNLSMVIAYGGSSYLSFNLLYATFLLTQRRKICTMFLDIGLCLTNTFNCIQINVQKSLDFIPQRFCISSQEMLNKDLNLIYRRMKKTSDILTPVSFGEWQQCRISARYRYQYMCSFIPLQTSNHYTYCYR